MSLYNTIAGVSVTSGICLGMLRLDPKVIARFRDAWIADDGATIILLTRTGGNNRADYAEENAMLRKVVGFVSDADDDYDSTFARFTFLVPSQFVADTKSLAELLRRFGVGANTRGPSAALTLNVLEKSKAEVTAEVPTPSEIKQINAAYTRIFKSMSGEG